VTETADKRLDGWKAIADHFQRNERTVMRWRKERGLPVHSVPGEYGSVYAYAGELDQWLRCEATPEGRDEPATGDSAGLPDPQSAADTAVPRVRAAANRARTWISLAAAGATLAIGLVWLLGPAPIGLPVRAERRGRELTAMDKNDRPVWTYRFAQPMVRDTEPGWGRPTFGEQVRLVDLDSDGRSEVLLLESLWDGKNLHSDKLHCLSHDGKLLWSYDPQAVLSFQGQRFEPPWMFFDLLFTAGSGGRPGEVWLSVAHHNWWPAFLVRLDAAGRATTAFVHAGHIYALSRWRDPTGRPFVLAGGINNEHAAAALAVLAEDGAPATSPQTAGSGYECDDCPPGRPDRFLVFPRSELSLIAGRPYNKTMEAVPSETGVIAWVAETWKSNDPAQNAWIAYALSKVDLTPQAAWMSDSYWALHRRLEMEGLLRHTADACPERTGFRTVRVWQPKTGWSEARVPIREPANREEALGPPWVSPSPPSP
jgi:hypothetical protein